MLCRCIAGASQVHRRCIAGASQVHKVLILIHHPKLKYVEPSERKIHTKFLQLLLSHHSSMASYVPMMKRLYLDCFTCFLDRMCCGLRRLKTLIRRSFGEWLLSSLAAGSAPCLMCPTMNPRSSHLAVLKCCLVSCIE